MNTITHIETDINSAGIASVYCTFALRGKRFVAYILGNKGDGNGRFGVYVASEDAHTLNRPYEYGIAPREAFGDDSLPEALCVKVPSLEDGFSATRPAQEVQREVEHRLLGAVASAYLHPKATEIVTATVDHVRLCDANRASSEEAQALHAKIKGFLNGRGLEYSMPTLASMGSRRAVKYMMAGAA